MSARLAIGAYFAVSLFIMATGITRHSLEQIVTGGFLAVVFFLLTLAAPRERNLVPDPALSPAENQK